MVGVCRSLRNFSKMIGEVSWRFSWNLRSKWEQGNHGTFLVTDIHIEGEVKAKIQRKVVAIVFSENRKDQCGHGLVNDGNLYLIPSRTEEQALVTINQPMSSGHFIKGDFLHRVQWVYNHETLSCLEIGLIFTTYGQKSNPQVIRKRLILPCYILELQFHGHLLSSFCMP